MSISKFRTSLYRTAKYLGDYQAIKNGKIGQRLFNRIIGNLLTQLFRK